MTRRAHVQFTFTPTRAWGLALFVGVALTTGVAQAAVINVTTTAMTIANDGQCSLPEAIQAVNTRAAVWSCPAGNGTDSAPDAIALRATIGAYTVADTLRISRSVIVRSATRNTPVVLESNGNYSEMFYVGTAAGALVQFEDLDLRGGNLGNTSALAAYNDAAPAKIVFLRCVVRFFTFGAFFIDGLHLDIIDTNITQNLSAIPGGGLFHVGGNLALRVLNSSIVLNTTSSSGGGIASESSGNAQIINSTISDNTAGGEGGGVYFGNSAGTVNVTGSTLVFNVADWSGGAGAGASRYTVNQSILTDNSPNDWQGHIASLSNSMVGPTGGLTLGTNSNNLLNVAASGVDGDLQDMGGIQFQNPVGHFLASTSPAVDALTSSAQTQDLRHYVRGVNVKNNGRRFDIGAIELDPFIQAESLFRTGATDTVNTVSVSGFQAPAGQGINLLSNAVGDSVSLVIPTPDGFRPFRVRVRRGPTGGRFQIETNRPGVDPPGVFAAVGNVIDTFASTNTVVELTPTTNRQFVVDGTIFRFRCVGRNSSSSGFQLLLDAVRFQ